MNELPMPKEVKAILFDCWGTLVEGGVSSVIAETKDILRMHNMKFPLFVTILESAIMTKRFETKQEAFSQLLHSFRRENNPNLNDKLIGLWNKNVLFSRLYEEVDEYLEILRKDYKIFLVSNMPYFSAEVIDKFNFKDKFDGIYLSCDVGQLKTSPKFFEKVLSDNNLKKDEVIMVGDSMATDIFGAQRQGIKPILMDRRNKRDYQPKVQNLAELKKLLNS